MMVGASSNEALIRQAPRLIRIQSKDVTSKLPPKCYLERMPMEILAEILSHTASPRDVLAIARCSKYFCATLVNNPSTVYIWKSARARCQPAPIPDPTSNWTEPSYASFLFDDGICEVCGKKVTTLPFSFALRLRLCGKPGIIPLEDDCRQVWMNTEAVQVSITNASTRYHQILQWVPRIELGMFEGIIPPSLRLTRKRDWEAAINDFNKANLSESTIAAFLEEKTLEMQHVKALNDHAGELVAWKKKREPEARRVKEHNDTMAERISKREGWEHWDMKTTESFSILLRCRTISFERMTENDIEWIRPTLEAQIISVREARKRRREENEYYHARAAVADRYRQLKSGKIAVPPLEDFRKLNTMRTIVKQPNAHRLLTKNTYDAPLNHEMERWVQHARNGLGKVLGFPGWKSASNAKVHVAERVNAWFLCTNCQKTGGQSGWDDFAMNFATACQHKCAHLSKKRRAKEVWSVDNFVADNCTIGAVNQVLRKAGIDPERDTAKDQVDKIGDRIVCLSCPSPIAMNFNTMVRHYRRHEDVKLDVVPLEMAKTISGQQQVDYGHRDRILRGVSGTKALRDKRIWVCRYCVEPCFITLDTTTPDVRIKSAWAPGETGPSEPTAPTEPTESASLTSGAESADSTDNVDTPMDEGEGSHSATQVSSTSPSGSPVPQTGTVHMGEGQGEDPAAQEQPSPCVVPSKKRREKVSTKATFTFNGLRSHAKAKHGIVWIGDEDFYQVPAAKDTTQSS